MGMKVVGEHDARVPSVAEAVRRYIDGHPVVRDALSMGIVNLSALTRKIMDETGLDKEDAILVTCRRYEPTGSVDFEQAILDMLHRAKLEVRTQAAALTVRSSWDLYDRLEETMAAFQMNEQTLHVIAGTEAATILTDDTVLPRLQEILGPEEVLKRRSGLVELNVRVPEESEQVPGLVAFLSGSLARKGINVLEVISVYKDNMFLVAEEDFFLAFETLNGLIRQGPVEV